MSCGSSVRPTCVRSRRRGSQRPSSLPPPNLPCCRVALDDADRAIAEGLQVATGDLAFAAPLYVIGVRAAAERAESAERVAPKRR